MRNKLPCDRIEMSSSVYTMCKIYCLLYTTHAQATLWCALGCVLRKLNSGLAFKLSSVIIMLGWLAWNVHLHISTYLETMFIESRVNVIHKGRGQKKNCEKAVRLTALGGEGGSPPLSLTTSICENFDPFLSFIKRQNNPKYGNLSRNFHIFLTASGEGRGGSTQAVSLTAFSVFF